MFEIAKKYRTARIIAHQECEFNILQAAWNWLTNGIS
jgi:quinolinate synthase